MDNNFFAYIERLELMAFFSGYPLLYAAILFIAGNHQSKNNFKSKMVSLLPLAYAMIGTLCLGLLLKNLYPDYSPESIKMKTQQPYLIIWALLSLLFWIPRFRKKTILSLVHSLVFFLFIAWDLIIHTFRSSADKSVVKNDMKIYTDSLLLNLGAYAFILLLFFLFAYNKKRSVS